MSLITHLKELNKSLFQQGFKLIFFSLLSPRGVIIIYEILIPFSIDRQFEIKLN